MKKSFKRALDLGLATSAIVLTSPILVFIVAALLLTRQSPFFSQTRVGHLGREFRCLKFQTMRPGAEAMLKEWERTNDLLWQEYVASNFKLKNDPRVTRIGAFLRKTSLDELPQLFNVLMGDMSLVGPRPLLRREVPDYGHANYLDYVTVKPGLTGLWQISGRSSTTFSTRSSLDSQYVKNWSLMFDLMILLKTPKAVLISDGAM